MQLKNEWLTAAFTSTHLKNNPETFRINISSGAKSQQGHYGSRTKIHRNRYTVNEKRPSTSGVL
jgi:hypothetical protein